MVGAEANMYMQLWRLVFPKRHLTTCRKWRRDNPGRMKVYGGSEKKKVSDRRWRTSANGRASLAAKEGRRRVRMQKGQSRAQKGVAKVYARCQELREWFDVVVDHIIPLAKGGAHSPGNLQIIYRLENLRKGVRLNYTPSVVFI